MCGASSLTDELLACVEVGLVLGGPVDAVGPEVDAGQRRRGRRARTSSRWPRSAPPSMKSFHVVDLASIDLVS